MSLVGMGGPMGGFGMGAGSMRFASTRGRIQGGMMQGMAYPSPFFDIAHTYLPATVKQMFRWTRYYFLTHGLINATVFKLAEYPVTDIIVDHTAPAVAAQWTDFFQENLHYRAFQIELGLDFFVYGNGFVTLSYPFKKYLTCTACNFCQPATDVQNHWTFTSNQFRLTCPQCGCTSPARVNDIYLKNPSGIRLMRWNPEDIEIEYNDITGEYTYFYTIPTTVKADIQLGKKSVVSTLPQLYIEATRQQKGVVFGKDKIFHLRRPTLSGRDRGWGIPLMLPILKDVFYMQVMKKAQEAILLEHIVPLRVIFPQAGSGTSDPYTTINLLEWREHISQEIAQWRLDNNYIPILPMPIGNQTIGGDGRALLLTGEMEQNAQQIMMGMGVPREFLQGGLSYAGTNVSMRMLENSFIGYILRHKVLANWVLQEIAAYLDWPTASIRFKPFKMADDIQRKAFLMQLNQAQKVSDTTLLSDSDLDQIVEDANTQREMRSRIAATKAQQVAMAAVQGEAQLVSMKMQAKAQKAMEAIQQQQTPPQGAPGGPEILDQGTPGGQPVEDRGGPDGEALGDPPMQQQDQQMPQQMPQEMQSPLGAEQQMPAGQAGGVDLPTLAYMYAQQIAQMSPDQQQLAIQSVMTQSPEMGQMVLQYLQQMGIDLTGEGGEEGGADQRAASEINMQPLPEQRGPRRAAGTV